MYFVFCIPSPHIAQCVGKRRTMMRCKILKRSEISRPNGVEILAKSEVFAPATSTCGISLPAGRQVL